MIYAVDSDLCNGESFMQWIVNYAVESDLCNGYENIQYQGPISRSMQLNYIPVTAFSSTDLFLDRI